MSDDMRDRLRRLTWAQLASWLPYSVAGTALLAVGLAYAQTLLQPPSRYFETVVGYSLVALVAVLVVRSMPLTPVLPRSTSETGLKTWLIVLHVAIWSLVVPVYLLVWRNSYDDMQDWTYEFLNKRWLAALYDLALLLVVVIPLAVYRALSNRQDDAEPSNIAPGRAPRVRSRVGRLAGVILALAVSWYFAGPPWNIARHHRSIDLHEQVHLGPLQAIHSGYTPFIGPAATPYGPGSQVVMYQLMRLSGHFDLVSFRQTFAALEFAAFVIIAVTAYFMVGPGPMLVIVLLAEAYSPLGYFRFDPDGTLHGLYGWVNPMRYLGTLVVVPVVSMVACRVRSTRTLTWLGLLLGVVWGVFSWLSQENLSATVVAMGLALAVMALTNTAPVSTLVRLVGGLAIGCIGTWAVVLGYYAVHGMVGSFIRNYLLVSSAVAMGFGSTWWSSGPLNPNIRGYYWTAPLCLALVFLVLWNPRTLRPRGPLDRNHVLLVSFICVLLASYQTVLYRSDEPHFINTLLALPFVLVLGVRDFPRAIATTWTGHLLVRVVFVAVAVWVYPLAFPAESRDIASDILMAPPGVDRPLSGDIWTRFIAPPAARLWAVPPAPPAADPRVPFQRTTRYLADEPKGVGDLPMRAVLDEGSALHDLVGRRRTYVQGMPGMSTGLAYFLFDLNPAPYLFDRWMIPNKQVKDEALWYFSQRLDDVECVIAESRSAPELQLFLTRRAGAQVYERAVGQTPYYVALVPPVSAPR